MENNTVYLLVGPVNSSGSNVIAVYRDKNQAEERAAYFNANPLDGETATSYHVESWDVT